MKKFLAILLVLSLIAALASCAAKEPAVTPDNAEEPSDSELGGDVGALAGGYFINDAAEPAELPENVQNAFSLAMENYAGMSFTPVAYLASQVVAGANYAVLCVGKPVVPDAVASLKVVVIYNGLDGNAEVLRVNDFNLTDYVSQSEDAPAQEPGLAGGWNANTEFPEASLDEEAKKACAAVFNGNMGVDYQPIACLGTQVVAGLNYAFLCKATSSADEANPVQLKVVTVYAALDGSYEVLSTSALDLADICGAQDVEE